MISRVEKTEKSDKIRFLRQKTPGNVITEAGGLPLAYRVTKNSNAN